MGIGLVSLDDFDIPGWGLETQDDAFIHSNGTNTTVMYEVGTST